jgi:hypothetical protein
MQVHQAVGDALEEKCLDWEIVVPMQALAFIRHQSWKPKACACREGVR